MEAETRGYTAPSQFHLVDQTNQIKELHTIIRDATICRGDFIFHSNRLIRLLVEEGLNRLPVKESSVITPTGQSYEGVEFLGKLCGVSIMRAGEAMEPGLRECCRSIRIGKILIQKDEATKQRKLYYAKFPPDIHQRHVLLMDPVLATGGTLCEAIEVLLDYGVKEENILFLTLIAAPEGINKICSRVSLVEV
eukprot:Colp12_sorted_trinity150504_noHs@9604